MKVCRLFGRAPERTDLLNVVIEPNSTFENPISATQQDTEQQPKM